MAGRAKPLKVPRHELAAIVDDIQKVLGFKEGDKYGYKYWLSVVKRSGKHYGEMVGILKETAGLDKKYNRGGYLTNKLSKKK